MTEQSDEAELPDGRTWLPIAAAASIAVVLVAVVVTLALRQGDGQIGKALSCPDSYRGTTAEPTWVPSKPAGVSASKNLVPDQTPTDAVVCAYGTSEILSGHKTLHGNLDVVRRTLGPLKKATSDPTCARSAGADDLLVGFTYATGTSWLSLPAETCVGVSNGSFRTSADLRPRVLTAYRTGTWPPSS